MTRTTSSRPFHVASYIAETAHLTAVEHGAYMMLLMTFWQTQSPLPGCHEKLATIARVAPARWPDVWGVIDDLFYQDESMTVPHRTYREAA